ncbi:alpha/beta hydrolase [Paenibacillus pinistramenti]|uniref:alpha/beta hydrolase n=1 Tax=Paenibacillus pinistramenti TaxID=1768003 RepID=UPI001EF11165|nr:alpha/beta hydrolase [Paenibacillus pinistramenti]
MAQMAHRVQMVAEQPFSLMNEDLHPVYVYHWTPEDSHAEACKNGGAENDADAGSRETSEPAREAALKGIVQIVHGMAETAKRYTETAAELVKQGYLVYAADLRGHGRTAEMFHGLGYAGKDGHNGMVQDIILLGSEIARRHPGLPLFLLGHSMGSFLVQKVMYTAPEPYAGFLLTGTCGRQPMIAIGEKLAMLQCSLQGDRQPSMLLNALVFGPYNRQFRPVRTPFDWLTRDKDEVDLFIKDPSCGELCSAGFFHDFFRLLLEIHKPVHMSRIPKHKPVFVFSGGQDPVGQNGKGVKRLIAEYERLGLQHLEWKLYPGARHELFHELNKAEVIRDVLAWLDRQVLQQPAASSDS